MHNQILSVFGATHLLDGYRHDHHDMVVRLDGRVIATILPEARGTHEMMQSNIGNVGPAFNATLMRRRIAGVFFGGDEAEMDRATVHLERRL